MDNEDKKFGGQIAADLAEIKANIGFIREIAEEYRTEFKDHVKEDKQYYEKTNHNTILVTLLWVIFGLTAFSALAQNIIQTNFGGMNAKTAFSVNAFAQPSSAASSGS